MHFGKPRWQPTQAALVPVSQRPFGVQCDGAGEHCAQDWRFGFGRRLADPASCERISLLLTTMTRHHFFSWRACRCPALRRVLFAAALVGAPLAYGAGSWVPDGAALTSGYGDKVA